jgi:tryptophanyl-tRNA synthetase
LQTADIVIYSEEGAQLYVPVGEDQVSHVELSREIVRRFNSFYGLSVGFDRWKAENSLGLTSALHGAGKLGPDTLVPKPLAVTKEMLLKAIEEEGAVNFVKRLPREDAKYISLREVLTEPGVMLTKTPRIPGLDGRKMSKSYGNAITLSETDEEIRKKTKVMVTDPARKRRTDPGNPDVCPVYDWHKLFSAGEAGRLDWVRQGCTTAGIGCIECKAAMAENLIQWIGPKREARNKWEKDPKGVVEMIDAGSKRARVEAKKNMERVREAVFGWGKKRQEVLVAEKK